MTRPAAVDAIAEAVAERREPAAEQLELLPPSRFAEGDERHARMVEAVRRHRAGRPPGARNIATRDAIEFIRRVFGDPLIESARVAMHTAETLAAELGCTKLEAHDRLEEIRKDLRRYMYAPRAPEDGEGNALPPTLVVVASGEKAGVTVDGKPLAPWEQAAQEIKQIQSVSAEPPGVSQADKSHGNG